MQHETLSLSLPAESGRRLASGWLLLALFSLVGAGLVVILIVLARQPVIHDLIPWAGSFRTALVIHVDLSVLVWFLSFAGLLAALTLAEHLLVMGWLALAIAMLGTVILTFSPFLGEDLPFMNNYVPVLNNAPFFVGLFLFAGGFSLLALLTLWSRRPAGDVGEQGMRFGLWTALVIFLLSVASLAWTWHGLRHLPTHDEHYFELLFWGGGHLLQFTHVQLQMLAWLWLGTLAGLPRFLTSRLVIPLFVMGALPALAGPVIHFLYPVDSGELRLAFTELMIYGGGIASVPLALVLVWALWKAEPVERPEQEVMRLALRTSLLLFAFGGLIGFMIRGINVTIPSHYHGSIVSVTLAYMGLAYHLLPALGHGQPLPRWAGHQLNIYAFGSLLHIIGLAWSGGHDVQRKTAGAAQGLQSLSEKVPMWIMGAGGMIAVSGGILFLVLAFRVWRRKGITS
ncbi:cbb3-type cytochrome c oxidase subunit I [Candidatus Magnetaquicoccus inordinatus]|uniref:cbb3-type cytochrome c oxidase subunit I n=1 Tax=Candidatus Magnetaquicoccus inordinatus TaxID=2496818 RepID=UPI00102C3F56|nr:cbb3-type cytochrome c oxidase subunit I [Candidatus Magnetaquicoccus inordinatus]